MITDVAAQLDARDAEAAEAELEADADPAVELDPDAMFADDDPPTDPGTSGRRKKKISFI